MKLKFKFILEVAGIESLFVGNFEGNDSTGTQLDNVMINRLFTCLLTHMYAYEW